MEKKAYAIDYILGYDKHTIVVIADDADDAFYLARNSLCQRKLHCASLQGSPREATLTEIGNAIESGVR